MLNLPFKVFKSWNQSKPTAKPRSNNKWINILFSEFAIGLYLDAKFRRENRQLCQEQTK
ncbi:hypothetical protein HanIR_Chr04g0200251 [Helianthus annuus]|nr:hypothetical protein HanIR_Chr04g0200251 [Helianthus annuus]